MGQYCRKIAGNCSFCSQCEDASNSTVKVIRLEEYKKMANLKLADEITDMAEAGKAAGMMFVVDVNGIPKIGISGSYQRDPAAALAEALKLVDALNDIVAVKKYRTN